MKRHLVVILTLTLTYFIGKRALDLLVWRELERETKLQAVIMEQLVKDRRN